MSCTGADAYAAHIRGAKHQKVGVFFPTHPYVLTLFSFPFLVGVGGKVKEVSKFENF